MPLCTLPTFLQTHHTSQLLLTSLACTVHTCGLSLCMRTSGIALPFLQPLHVPFCRLPRQS